MSSDSSKIDQGFPYIWSKRFYKFFADDFLFDAQNIFKTQILIFKTEIISTCQCQYAIKQAALV